MTPHLDALHAAHKRNKPKQARRKDGSKTVWQRRWEAVEFEIREARFLTRKERRKR